MLSAQNPVTVLEFTGVKLLDVLETHASSRSMMEHQPVGDRLGSQQWKVVIVGCRRNRPLLSLTMTGSTKGLVSYKALPVTRVRPVAADRSDDVFRDDVRLMRSKSAAKTESDVSSGRVGSKHRRAAEKRMPTRDRCPLARFADIYHPRIIPPYIPLTIIGYYVRRRASWGGRARSR